MSQPNCKRRWQFSLRTLVLLMTLASMLAIGAHRFRQWGKELHIQRSELLAERFRWSGVRFGKWSERQTKEWDAAGKKAIRQHEEFERKYWLPIAFYYRTSWDPDSPIQKTVH